MSTIFSSNDVEQLDKDDNENNQEDVEMNDIEESESNADHHKNDNDKNNEEEGSQQDDKNPMIPPIPEFTRADKTLDELLDLLDDADFTPIIPDAVTDYYLNKSGLSLNADKNNNDIDSIKIKRLIALATQKFISDIATDAYEYSRIRCNSAVYTANNPQTRSRQLLMATMAKAKGGNTNNNASSGNSGNTNSTNNNAAGNNNATGAAGADINDDNDESNTNTNTNLNSSLGQSKEKVTLTIDDLSSALEEYGLNINRPQFYR